MFFPDINIVLWVKNVCTKFFQCIFSLCKSSKHFSKGRYPTCLILQCLLPLYSSHSFLLQLHQSSDLFPWLWLHLSLGCKNDFFRPLAKLYSPVNNNSIISDSSSSSREIDLHLHKRREDA